VYRPLDHKLAIWPKPAVERVIANGDWGTVQFSWTGGLGTNGTDDNMSHCWVMRREGERIAAVIGYDDTARSSIFSHERSGRRVRTTSQ